MLDYMIIQYFRVLPTDPRFKALTQNQKLQILFSFQEVPVTFEDMRTAVRQKESSVPDVDEKDLLQVFDEDEAAFMVEQIKTARQRQ